MVEVKTEVKMPDHKLVSMSPTMLQRKFLKLSTGQSDHWSSKKVKLLCMFQGFLTNYSLCECWFNQKYNKCMKVGFNKFLLYCVKYLYCSSQSTTIQHTRVGAC